MTTLKYSHFTTDAYPGDRRVDAWRDALGHVSLGLQDTAKLGNFYGQARSVVSPLGIHFTRLAASGQSLTGLAPRAEPGVWIALQLAGGGKLDSADGRAEIAVGDLAYGPLCGAFGLSYADDFRVLFILLPQPVLQSRGLASLVKRPGSLRGERGTNRIFSDMLAAVAEDIETLSADGLRPVEIALLEFFASCMADEVGEDGLRGETGTQMNILNRICQIVEAHLGEADFSRATVARKEGISARYVQRLFENAGDTFGHYLRRRRLERCRLDLINPTLSHKSITEISYRWGFNDSAHFSRAFRDEYGLSPREFRKQADAAANTIPVSQIGRGWPQGSGKVLRRVSLSRNHEWLPKIEPKPAPKRTPGKPASVIKPAFAVAAAHRHHYVPASEKTVHWGYFSKSLPPVLVMNSGELVTLVRSMGLKPTRISYRSPWQNGVAERFVGMLRRELLDYTIVLNDRHLRRLLFAFVEYHHEDRTHLGLCKDTPLGRPKEPRPEGSTAVVAHPRVGGLHHSYSWRAAA